MITIDSRVGSKDLLKHLPNHKAKPGRLEFGDASFLGNGPEGAPWLVGVERKKVPDLVKSMEDGRLSGHQLVGMQASYKVSYLLVEGAWRGNPATGALEIPKGRGKWQLFFGQHTAAGIEGYLNTLAVLGGVYLLSAPSPRQTALKILALYRWWSKPWEQHTSHLQMDLSRPEPPRRAVLASKPRLVRKMARMLPGIGWTRSQAVEERFKTVKEMVEASEEEWEMLPGIGGETATRVVKALKEEVDARSLR